MKKTLIALAALAMASVASAVTLDFTQPGTLPSSVTFEGGDTIILNGDSSFVGNDYSGSSFTSGGVTVSTNRAFNDHENRDGKLDGGTIEFGTNGKITGEKISLQNMDLTFKATLDFVLTTTDASLVGTTTVMTRTLMDVSGGLWYRGMTSNAYTMSVSAADSDIALTLKDLTGTHSNNGISRTLYNGTTEAAGTWQVYNEGANDISLAYVVTYVAAPVTPDIPGVPEPTTATLSLLALAGLAARRRRK